jgi:SNF2 family DNA or RNA helicase
MTTTLARVDIDPDKAGRIAVWSDYRVKDAVKAVPGAKWDADLRRWTVPLTWPSCISLRAQLGDALAIEPDLNEWAYKVRAEKEVLRALHRDIEGDTLPDFTVLPGFEALYPYQRVAAYAISQAGSYGLFDQTGTGKSRSSLAGLAVAQHLGGEIFPMLILAPKSMLGTWAREEVPNYFPDAVVSIVAGTPTATKKALEPGADIYVTTYDTLRRYSRHAPYPTVKLTDEEKTDKELNAIGFKSTIADECHRVKNPASKQTRALWHVSAGANYRVGLTGTPMQDTPEDLWAIMRYLSPEEYPTKTAYVERYLDVTWNLWGGREIKGLNPAHADEFINNLETRYRRVTKDAVLKFLPPKVYEVRWVELPPKMRKAYDAMKKVMVAELESGDVLAAKSPLERAGRLTQLANASGEIDPDTGEFRMGLPSPKIDAFMDDVTNGDYDGQQVVVFSDSRQLIDLLSEVMTKKKIAHVSITGSVVGDDRDAARDMFQSGAVQFILLTRAGGEGITLTAASTMVRLVRAWSYIVHTQSEDRVHRIGSERHESISYIDYIVEGTVEEGQIARLNAKGARAQEVLRDEELLELLKT